MLNDSIVNVDPPQIKFGRSDEALERRVARLRELVSSPEVKASYQKLLSSIVTEDPLKTARDLLKIPGGMEAVEAGILLGGLFHHPCFIALTEAVEAGNTMAKRVLLSAFDRRAIYAGSFDPFTLGHRDIAARAARIFDEVIIAVGINPSKDSLFSVDEKISMIKKDVESLPGQFQVINFQSLVATRAQELGACALIRGVRGITDLDAEIQQALANRLQGGERLDLETCILIARQEFQNHSSTNVRTLARFRGGDISPYLSPYIATVTRDKVHGSHLRNTWNELFRSSELEQVLKEEEFSKLYEAYRSPSRFYHNAEHIYDMFLLLNEYITENPSINFPLDEMRAAIFFHDFVYDASQQDNEIASMEVARGSLRRLGWNEEKIKRVCQYIEATIKHNVIPDLLGCDVFLDLDLSILGSGYERYLRYANDIRQEYRYYAENEFFAGRADFLEKFLKRTPLFVTEWGYNRFERLARENIKAEIAILRAS